MSKMAHSWDEEVHESLLRQLLKEHYGEEGASLNDRRPYVDVARQPDLLLLDESGEANRYAYFLQPVEVKVDLFDQLAREEPENLDVFVPYDLVEKVEEWIESRGIDAGCSGYRLVCGQLRIRSGDS